MTLPKPIPPLYGEAAERFEEIDKIPLTEEEIEFLIECHMIYLSKPITVVTKERKGGEQ